jgi:transglutaminase/protease-like cytokinesis protein 3
MRITVLSFVLLSVNFAFGQKHVDFALIDQQARSTDASSLDCLAEKLTAPYKTDLEKTRSIFIWITSHIAYNTKSFSRRQKAYDVYLEPDDGLPQLKPLNERTAQIVFERRTAVCEGYARLFKSLCDRACIKAELINGYAKNNTDKPGFKFRTNHTWNAVYVDSSWHLLDVTWASGFIANGSDDFIRSLDEYYFFTDPGDFIRDHYPEDCYWTLLTDPPLAREFYQSPFKYSGFAKERVTAYSPAKGIIQAVAGDSVSFQLRVNNTSANVFVTDHPSVDAEGDIILPKDVGSAISSYKVPPVAPSWLYVVCNGEIVLRYKLIVKNEEMTRK